MTKTEVDRVNPTVTPFQCYVEEEGKAEEVIRVATEQVAKPQNPQPDTVQTEDTPPTDEEEAFFRRMPPEFFDDLRRRAEFAMTQPGIPIAEARCRLRSARGVPSPET